MLEMVKKLTFVSDNNIETPSTIVVIPRPQDLEESGIKIGTTYIWIWPTYSFADMEILQRIGTINTYNRYKLVYAIYFGNDKNRKVEGCPQYFTCAA